MTYRKIVSIVATYCCIIQYPSYPGWRHERGWLARNMHKYLCHYSDVTCHRQLPVLCMFTSFKTSSKHQRKHQMPASLCEGNPSKRDRNAFLGHDFIATHTIHMNCSLLAVYCCIIQRPSYLGSSTVLPTRRLLLAGRHTWIFTHDAQNPCCFLVKSPSTHQVMSFISQHWPPPAVSASISSFISLPLLLSLFLSVSLGRLYVCVPEALYLPLPLRAFPYSLSLSLSLCLCMYLRIFVFLCLSVLSVCLCFCVCPSVPPPPPHLSLYIYIYVYISLSLTNCIFYLWSISIYISLVLSVWNVNHISHICSFIHSLYSYMLVHHL